MIYSYNDNNITDIDTFIYDNDTTVVSFTTYMNIIAIIKKIIFKIFFIVILFFILFQLTFLIFFIILFYFTI